MPSSAPQGRTPAPSSFGSRAVRCCRCPSSPRSRSTTSARRWATRRARRRGSPLQTTSTPRPTRSGRRSQARRAPAPARTGSCIPSSWAAGSARLASASTTPLAGDETYDLYVYRADYTLIASTHPFASPGVTDAAANNARGPSTASAPQVLTLAAPAAGRYYVAVSRAKVGDLPSSGSFGAFVLTLDEVAPRPPRDPVVVLVKTGPETGAPGETLTYELTWNNAGPGAGRECSRHRHPAGRRQLRLGLERRPVRRGAAYRDLEARDAPGQRDEHPLAQRASGNLHSGRFRRRQPRTARGRPDALATARELADARRPLIAARAI